MNREGGCIDVSLRLPSALKIALRNGTVSTGEKKRQNSDLSNIFLWRNDSFWYSNIAPAENVGADFSLNNTKKPESDV